MKLRSLLAGLAACLIAGAASAQTPPSHIRGTIASLDGQTLIVRGYLGFELLGQNQYWTRLPDSAFSQLDPSINPNVAVAPGAAAKHPPAHKAAQQNMLRQ